MKHTYTIKHVHSYSTTVTTSNRTVNSIRYNDCKRIRIGETSDTYPDTEHVDAEETESTETESTETESYMTSIRKSRQYD